MVSYVVEVTEIPGETTDLGRVTATLPHAYTRVTNPGCSSDKRVLYHFAIQAQWFEFNNVNIKVIGCRIFEPRSEKTGFRGFRPGPTQIGLQINRRWLEA